jgi:uncharacterized protein involved in exopolysaccharide biosynthesis
MDRQTTQLTYGDIVGILRDSWLAVGTCTILGAVVAAGIALSMTPIYRAQVLLAPAAATSSGGSTIARIADQFAPLAGLIGSESSGGFAGKDVWIAALASRRLLERFIRDRALAPALFPEEWDPVSMSWKDDPPTINQAIERFEELRGVSEDRRTSLVTLSVEGTDPRLVAEWATGLVDEVNTFLRDRAIEEAKRSIAFLEEELAETSVVERQQIIYRLIESKTSEIMMANARDEYAFVVVDPAMTPDEGSFVRPRRALLVGIGLLLGLCIGIFYAGARWANSTDEQLEAANQSRG